MLLFRCKNDKDGVNEIDLRKIILLVVTVLIGIGLSIFSIINIRAYNEKNKTYIEATATVVDYEYDRDEEGRELATIIVEYKVDRNTYKLKDKSSTTNPQALGSKVKIKYNPSNPSDAIFSNDNTYIITLVVGIIFALVGGYASVKEIKDNN